MKHTEDNDEEVKDPIYDISLSPQTSRCRWARMAPLAPIHSSQKQITKETTKTVRMNAFHRQETGLEGVKMIIRHRS